MVEVLEQEDWKTCWPISRMILTSTSLMICHYPEDLLLVVHLSQLSKPRKRKRRKRRMSKKKMTIQTGTAWSTKAFASHETAKGRRC